MKEMKITRKEFKQYEKDGIITFCPVCIDCAYEIINLLLEHYPDSSITMTSLNVVGLFEITAVRPIPDEDEIDEMIDDIPF